MAEAVPLETKENILDEELTLEMVKKSLSDPISDEVAEEIKGRIEVISQSYEESPLRVLKGLLLETAGQELSPTEFSEAFITNAKKLKEEISAEK